MQEKAITANFMEHQMGSHQFWTLMFNQKYAKLLLNLKTSPPSALCDTQSESCIAS